jgi:hypothetical protein
MRSATRPGAQETDDTRFALLELGRMTRLTEHEMLITIATMAIKMDDLTWHDVIETLRAHGYAHVVAEARESVEESQRKP